MSEHVLAISTIGSEEEAVKLAKALVERRLAACVNVVGTVRSLYRWKGSIEDDFEHLLLIKTTAERYQALEIAVRELHPYDVPELIVLSIEKGAEAYLGWVRDSVAAV